MSRKTGRKKEQGRDSRRTKRARGENEGRREEVGGGETKEK